MIKDTIKKCWFEVTYIIISIIFMVKLNSLNRVLFATQLNDEPFQMLMHDNYKPIKFFALTLFFAAISICEIVFRIRKIRNFNLSTSDIFMNVMIIIIMFVIAIVLFWLINNPILRAIIIVMGIGGAIVASIS